MLIVVCMYACMHVCMYVCMYVCHLPNLGFQGWTDYLLP